MSIALLVFEDFHPTQIAHLADLLDATEFVPISAPLVQVREVLTAEPALVVFHDAVAYLLDHELRMRKNVEIKWL